MKSLNTAVIGLSLLSIAACDTKPRAGFEESLKEANERVQGDKFGQLNNAKGWLTNYLQSEPNARDTYLSSYSASASGYVSTALATLADMDMGAHVGVANRCKPAVDAALAFRSEQPETGVGLEAQRQLQALHACRRTASEAEAGSTGETREALEGWRRTASTAMVILGSTVVEKGDPEEGIALWREADKAMAADRPGRKLSARDFQYRGF